MLACTVDTPGKELVVIRTARLIKLLGLRFHSAEAVGHEINDSCTDGVAAQLHVIQEFLGHTAPQHQGKPYNIGNTKPASRMTVFLAMQEDLHLLLMIATTSFGQSNQAPADQVARILNMPKQM